MRLLVLWSRSCFVAAPPSCRTSPPEERRTIEIVRRTRPSLYSSPASRSGEIFSPLDVQQIPSGTGSGFVWDREGHIVTNCHVIQDAVTRLVPQVITRGRAIQAGIGASFIPQRFNAAIGIKDGAPTFTPMAPRRAPASPARSSRAHVASCSATASWPSTASRCARKTISVTCSRWPGVGATVTLTVAHQSARRDVRIVLGQE
jgi:hypothetical protein